MIRIKHMSGDEGGSQQQGLGPLPNWIGKEKRAPLPPPLPPVSPRTKGILILPLFVLAFLAYWGVAWFCSDARISNAPIHALSGILRTIGEPAFCSLAVVGSFGLPIYVVFLIFYFTMLKRKQKEHNAGKEKIHE